MGDHGKQPTAGFLAISLSGNGRYVPFGADGPGLVADELPSLECLLLVPLVAINPRRLTRQTRAFRVLSLTLVAALQVGLTNIIVFGPAYWELDRGGPVGRTQVPRSALPPADFRFSQDENDDAIQEVADCASGTSDWVPTLVDHLYVSVTDSTAFGPTDTMPLSIRAKLLVSIQSVSALLTSLLVIARAVSILHRPAGRWVCEDAAKCYARPSPYRRT